MPEIDILLLYKKLYLIRKVEETIQKYYDENEMKTPMHMSLGEEAIVAGICGSLKKEDQVFGTHRSHALYLSKTEETDLFFLELYGKKNGIANGKNGSMHLSNPEYGFMGGSAIVGGNFAMATGAAFANKFKKNNKIVVVFFGDGAIDEGSFWESFNIACLLKLPIIFVCEDNDLAVYTGYKKRHGYKNITNIVSNFNCKTVDMNSTDIIEISSMAETAIKEVRKYNCPYFMCLKYCRYLDHVGVNEDFHFSYRFKDENYYKWIRKDPVLVCRKRVLKKIDEQVIIDIEKKIDNQIINSLNMAKKSFICDSSELYNGVYCG